MAAITRKSIEGITFGSDIEVNILTVQGEQIRLGSQVPTEVFVHRGAASERTCQENQEAAHAGHDHLPGLCQAWQNKG